MTLGQMRMEVKNIMNEILVRFVKNSSDVTIDDLGRSKYVYSEGEIMKLPRALAELLIKNSAAMEVSVGV